MNYEQICDIEETLQEARLRLQHKNRPEKEAIKQALKIIDGIIWNWGNYSYADNKEQEIKDLKDIIKKSYHYVTNAPYGKDSPVKQKIARAYLIMKESKNEGTKEFLEEFSDEV